MLEINWRTTPQGGWRYFQEETGTLIEGPHFQGLVDKVANHRAANNLPIEPGWEQDIVDYMCQEIPGACKDRPSEEAPSITMGQVLHFTRILGDALLNGHERVELDEATERASICATCPSNVKPAGCIPCGLAGAANLLSKFVGARETSHDNQLESCKHCGCLNKAQVWFQLELLQRHMSDKVNEELPDHCWKKL
jgi:hypothetical protein